MKKSLLTFALVVIIFALVSQSGISFVSATNKNVESTNANASNLTLPSILTPVLNPVISSTLTHSPLPAQIVQPAIVKNNIKVDVAPAIINNNIQAPVQPTVTTVNKVVNNNITNVTNVTNITNVTNVTNVTCNCSQCGTQPGVGGTDDPGPTTPPVPTSVMVSPVLESSYVDEATGDIILYIQNNKKALDWSMYLHMTTNVSAEDKRIDLGPIGSIVSQISDGGLYGHFTTRNISDFPSGTILTFWVSYYETVGYVTRETAPSNMVQVLIP